MFWGINRGTYDLAFLTKMISGKNMTVPDLTSTETRNVRKGLSVYDQQGRSNYHWSMA